MKLLRIILFIFVLAITSGCFYSGINGKVVDSATGKPIEGAIVVAQWVKIRGIPGMQIHELHKITETLTDKEGKFSLNGTIGVLIDQPIMIVFKEGYIPWRNDSIFPGGGDGLIKVPEWNHNATYKLEVFSNKYTAKQLYRFLDYGIIGLGDAPKFHKIHKEQSDKAVDETIAQQIKLQKPQMLKEK